MAGRFNNGNPLHKLRKAERGFNQADIIAKAIGKRGKNKIQQKYNSENPFYTNPNKTKFS
ncbi:MAG: hypothetical protein H6613_01600 [Ignavibacteriales bacterium]|nr:hypothetical protein [Ignavibacteriales bacterium]